MPILYRVEYTPPVLPSQAWTKSNAILVVEVTDAEFVELGFGNENVCSVEWMEKPNLFVELWRREEDAIKVYPKLVISQRRREHIIQAALEEDRPYWDKDS